MRPIVMNLSITNWHTSETDNKPYYYFLWEDSLEHTGKSGSGVRISKKHPIFQKIGIPRENWRYFFVGYPTNKIKEDYGVKGYFYEEDANILELIELKQCYVCSGIEDNWNECECSCTFENRKEKHICHKK